MKALKALRETYFQCEFLHKLTINQLWKQSKDIFRHARTQTVDHLFLYHEEDSLGRIQNRVKSKEIGKIQENDGTNPKVQWKEIPRMQLYSRPKKQWVHIRTRNQEAPKNIFSKKNHINSRKQVKWVRR